MPELPEVEVIRVGLQKKIVGKTLKKIEILNPKTFQGNPKEAENKKVVDVWRRAKMLGIDLAGNLTLLFHLKLTGQLILVKGEERVIGGHPTEDMKGQMPSNSTRVIFEFSDGAKLYFNDQRKFGWIKLVKSQMSRNGWGERGQEIEKVLGELGPEPLEKSFTWEVLKENLLKRKNMPVKVALMNQSLIAGIGNIYASESLFLAKIDPRRKVFSLSDAEFKKLHQGIRESLETAIKAGGSTRAHFVNVEGERGYYLDFANVYGKEGQLCRRRCGGKIEKIIQAGRGTYFCPNCQK